LFVTLRVTFAFVGLRWITFADHVLILRSCSYVRVPVPLEPFLICYVGFCCSVVVGLRYVYVGYVVVCSLVTICDLHVYVYPVVC